MENESIKDIERLRQDDGAGRGERVAPRRPVRRSAEVQGECHRKERRT